MNNRPQPRIARFAALSRAERRLFFQSVFLIPAVRLAVRIFGLQNAQHWMESHAKRRSSRGKVSKEQNGLGPQAIVRMVEAAARHGIASGNCLSQSLVLWFLLQRNSWNAQFCMGGRRAQDSFEAHAWVELNREALNDRDKLRGTFRRFEARISQELPAEK